MAEEEARAVEETSNHLEIVVIITHKSCLSSHSLLACCQVDQEEQDEDAGQYSRNSDEDEPLEGEHEAEQEEAAAEATAAQKVHACCQHPAPAQSSH